jgi:hypothetical protein
METDIAECLMLNCALTAAELDKHRHNEEEEQRLETLTHPISDSARRQVGGCASLGSYAKAQKTFQGICTILESVDPWLYGVRSHYFDKSIQEYQTPVDAGQNKSFALSMPYYLSE